MSGREADETKADVSTENGELPEGWSIACLGDGIVTDVQPGFACGANYRSGDGVPHLRPMNVNIEGEISLSDVKFIPKSKVDSDRRWLRKNDVLFNNTNSTELVGKTAVYTFSEPRSFSNHMTRIRCQKDALDARYCAMALHHKRHEGYFQTVCNQHVSQSSVSSAVLLESSIRLPPQAEQKRIVAQVESLLSRTSAARERMAKVPSLLARLRQSILGAAAPANSPPTGEKIILMWRKQERLFGIKQETNTVRIGKPASS